MAPVLRSKSRGKGAKTSSESLSPVPVLPLGLVVIDDDDAIANDAASLGAHDSLSPAFQTPPLPPRRSLRLSTPSASASPCPKAPNPNPNPNLWDRGSTAAPGGAVGKRKARPSLEKEEEEEEEEEEVEEEGGCMTLRSGSQIRVALRETTRNAQEANHHCYSSTPGRRWGRPKGANPSDQDQQLQQAEKDMREGDGDKEEAKREERHLSLRSSKGGVDKDKGRGKLIIDQNLEARTRGVCSSGFLDKGKAKMIVDEDSELSSVSDFSSGVEEYSQLFVRREEVMPVYNAMPPEAPAPAPVLQPRRAAQRNRAIELAPKYAFFKDDDAGDSDSAEIEESVPDAGAHDWPGPFSTAMKIIEEREAILRAREEAHSSKGSQSAAVPISWTPSKDKRADGGSFAKKPLSLKSLCIRVLADNANDIESLEALPDMVKSMLIPVICHTRKMTARLLSELVRGSPVELQLSDCSWAVEREFEDIFTCCDTSKLKASVSSGLRILCVEMQCITLLS